MSDRSDPNLVDRSSSSSNTARKSVNRGAGSGRSTISDLESLVDERVLCLIFSMVTAVLLNLFNGPGWLKLWDYQG